MTCTALIQTIGTHYFLARVVQNLSGYRCLVLSQQDPRDGEAGLRCHPLRLPSSGKQIPRIRPAPKQLRQPPHRCARGDHDTAETFYKRAIDADPKHASILGNYGKFLLYRSERDRGFDFLDRSDKAARDTGDFNKMVKNDICWAIHSAGAGRGARCYPVFTGLFALLNRHAPSGRGLSESVIFPPPPLRIGNGSRS